jgi:hypothetical protein
MRPEDAAQKVKTCCQTEFTSESGLYEGLAGESITALRPSVQMPTFEGVWPRTGVEAGLVGSASASATNSSHHTAHYTHRNSGENNEYDHQSQPTSQ